MEVLFGFIKMGHQKKMEQEIEAVGKSRGGQSTKIHAACDALGNPVRFIVTPGQSSEFGQSNALIEEFNADYVLGDKGYDSNDFVAEIEESGAKPVIPPKKNRIEQREYDSDIYKERNLIERLFQKLKRFRRIASRFEGKAKHFLSMLLIASSVIWLK